MTIYEDKFRELFNELRRDGFAVAEISAMDPDRNYFTLATWSKDKSFAPENMPEEYTEGFDLAVKNSAIVNRCMQLPLSVENRLRAAVHHLYQRVLDLEAQAVGSRLAAGVQLKLNV